MSKAILLLSALEPQILIELVQLIISIYVGLPQKFKPGQIVFEAPCGHLLRFVTHFDPFGKEIYDTSMTPCYIDDGYLIESTEDESITSCKTCNRHWDSISHIYHADGIQKMMCFCKKISSCFPCGRCSAKVCSIPDCERVADGKSFPVLCTEHLRCKGCKQEISCSFSTPDNYGFEGWIKSYCFGRKNKLKAGI